jgi:DNA-binding LytR/AlgR family response regulator
MDMLVYLALATLAAALVAQQRAAEASAHSAELSRALDGARAALSARAAGPESIPRLLVSTGSKQIVVTPDEVEWFASAGNYVVVNWAGREGLIRETLTALEARLDPAVFARSHRSTIVNLARVRETASLSDGSWRLTVDSGAELVVSRTYRDAVLARLRD